MIDVTMLILMKAIIMHRREAYAFHLLNIITNTTGTSNRGWLAAPLSIQFSETKEKQRYSK